MVGWWIIPAAGRAAGASLSQGEHIVLTAALGGIFLGGVEGMIEESFLKTVRGAAAGCLGGIVGALLGLWILHLSNGASGTLAIIVTWAVAGLFIGLSSARPERRGGRMAAGGIVGFIGGGLGGWLGYQMYASLTDMLKDGPWGAKRMIEGATGAILGALLWFVMGLVGKLIILRRRKIENVSYKECDLCHHTNVLKAWYCANCGAILQVAAPPEKLDISKRQALSRFISACQYLGRLVALTSVVVAVLAAFFLGAINTFLGLFGLLATALIGYISYVLFNALAEVLTPLL